MLISYKTTDYLGMCNGLCQYLEGLQIPDVTQTVILKRWRMLKQGSIFLHQGLSLNTWIGESPS